MLQQMLERLDRVAKELGAASDREAEEQQKIHFLSRMVYLRLKEELKSSLVVSKVGAASEGALASAWVSGLIAMLIDIVGEGPENVTEETRKKVSMQVMKALEDGFPGLQVEYLGIS